MVEPHSCCKTLFSEGRVSINPTRICFLGHAETRPLSRGLYAEAGQLADQFLLAGSGRRDHETLGRPWLRDPRSGRCWPALHHSMGFGRIHSTPEEDRPRPVAGWCAQEDRSRTAGDWNAQYWIGLESFYPWAPAGVQGTIPKTLGQGTGFWAWKKSEC